MPSTGSTTPPRPNHLLLINKVETLAEAVPGIASEHPLVDSLANVSLPTRYNSTEVADHLKSVCDKLCEQDSKIEKLGKQLTGLMNI